MPRHNETIAALSTPVGTAALAVLRVSGPDTPRIAQDLLGAAPPPRLARHADYRGLGGETIDDVVMTFFQGPNSYTGEDALEISCHGNPFIAQKILEDLFARGCRPATAGEFTQRAFLNGRMDLSQAEAVMDVIHARSERALAAANQQLRGSLGRRMNELVDRLLAVLARIEAYTDFPDEDLPAEDRGIVEREIARLSEETGRLLATSHYGELLRDGIKTVIVGEPNVGKSSLLNRLVGRERALVSPEPGTTRDFIEERIIVGPHCLRLIDTAGLNPSPAPLEKLGMEKTLERLDEADLVLAVVDGSIAPQRLPDGVSQIADGKLVTAINKSDLATGAAGDLSLLPIPNSVRISAVTGDGIERLMKIITSKAGAFQRDTGGETIAVSVRHAHALTTARASLGAAADNLGSAGPVELLASDLRSALSAYGEITGKVDNERMLDSLFATFCIGK